MAERKISVYICGAHCAGKTTLLRTLQMDGQFTQFKFKVQEEIARNWIDQNGYTQAMLRSPDVLFSMEKTLLELQVLKEENEVAEPRVFIGFAVFRLEHNGSYDRFLWDRGIIDCIAYTKVFCGSKEVDDCVAVPGVAEMLERLKKADDTLVVVPKPEREFIVSDGTRLDSDIDELMVVYNATLDILGELGIPHLIVNVFDLTKRVEVVLNEVISKWPWMMNWP